MLNEEPLRLRSIVRAGVSLGEIQTHQKVEVQAKEVTSEKILMSLRKHRVRGSE